MANRYAGATKHNASAFKSELYCAQKSMNREDFVRWCERQNIEVKIVEKSSNQLGMERWVYQKLFGSWFWESNRDGYNSYPVTPRLKWKMCENPPLEEDESTKLMLTILEAAKKKQKLKKENVIKIIKTKRDDKNEDPLILKIEVDENEGNTEIVQDWILNKRHQKQKKRSLWYNLRSLIDRKLKKFSVSPADSPFAKTCGTKFYNLFFDVDESDIENMENGIKPVSVEAVSRLLYTKIGNYNWNRNKKYRISLLHSFFINDLFVTESDSLSDCSSDSSLQDYQLDNNLTQYMAFFEKSTRRVMVPILKSDGQFVLFLIERVKKGIIHVYLFDSTLNEYINCDFDHKSNLMTYIKRMVIAVFPNCQDDICFFQAGRRQIHQQESVHDSGIHVIRNVEGILRRKHFLKNVINIRARVSDDPFMSLSETIRKERRRLAEELRLTGDK